MAASIHKKNVKSIYISIYCIRVCSTNNIRYIHYYVMSPLAVCDRTHWGNLETLSAWWWWDSPYVSIKAVSVVSPRSLASWPHSANKNNDNMKHSQKKKKSLSDYMELNDFLLVKDQVMHFGLRNKTKHRV